MKTAFIVKVDSFSDVITNSSTDIFACKSEKSIKAIEELLNGIAKAAGEDAGLTVEEQTIRQFWLRTKDYCILDMGYDYVFDKEWNVIGFTKRKNYSYNKEKEVDPELTEEKLFNEWLERYAHIFSNRVWSEKTKNYITLEEATPNTKVIVICGNDDNSIPYWLQEFITSKLHALRYHLG